MPEIVSWLNEIADLFCSESSADEKMANLYMLLANQELIRPKKDGGFERVTQMAVQKHDVTELALFDISGNCLFTILLNNNLGEANDIRLPELGIRLHYMLTGDKEAPS